jgi:transketolase
MALNARYLDRLDYRTYVLLGDSEMAEGSQWEAIQIAAHYKLNNLIGVLDVNRLGQRGETMYGHDLEKYRDRIGSFGWKTIVVDDGHDTKKVRLAFEQALQTDECPSMIIARTQKGKGVSFLEDAEGWHGKTLDEKELKAALKELKPVSDAVRGKIAPPADKPIHLRIAKKSEPFSYKPTEEVPTRKAYGNALKRLGCQYPTVVSLDGEVSNSTYAELFHEAFPERYFEMYIAEQNMVGTAVGLGLRGKQPFVSTFAAFLTRAFDQIRMSRYSNTDLKVVGSHVGVSIGQDGPSQMGLEDLAMFRTIPDSIILYPSDAVSTERLVEAMIVHRGLSYLRTTRGKTPVIYTAEDDFTIGGCKLLRQSNRDVATVIGAGITLHEALKASDQLKAEGIFIRVIDLYSIKPLDAKAIQQAADETKFLITVEDHYPEGGIGEAVRSALNGSSIRFESLAVRRRPKSGRPEELLEFEQISAKAIVDCVKRQNAIA